MQIRAHIEHNKHAYSLVLVVPQVPLVPVVPQRYLKQIVNLRLHQ